MSGNDMNVNEYKRIRRNILGNIRRAKQDDIIIEDIEDKVPAIPKRITEGSVRRIDKFHKAVKDEVARRRRLARYQKEKTPALDNLRDMIKKALKYKDTKFKMENGKTRKITQKYRDMVNQSGEKADKLVKLVIDKEINSLKNKFPKTSERTLKKISESRIEKRAEKLLREEYDKVDSYLWGYQYPIEDPKPIYYMVMRQLLGVPVSPEEREEIFSGIFDSVYNFEEYEV